MLLGNQEPLVWDQYKEVFYIKKISEECLMSKGG